MSASSEHSHKYLAWHPDDIWEVEGSYIVKLRKYIPREGCIQGVFADKDGRRPRGNSYYFNPETGEVPATSWKARRIFVGGRYVPLTRIGLRN